MVLASPPPILKPRLITVDEFWEISNAPENAEKRLELIDGVIVEMPSSSNINTVVATRISGYLMLHVDENNLGYATGPDGGFRLDDYNAPQPDAAFIRKERADLSGKNFEGAPDLAVEVISPSETRPMIARKIRRYLENGGQIVWAVYPEDEVVEVYQLNSDGSFNVRVVEKDGILEGGDVLPDFQLPLTKVFR